MDATTTMERDMIPDTPNLCLFCPTNNMSFAESCEKCDAVLIPPRDRNNQPLTWRLLSIDLRTQPLDNGMARDFVRFTTDLIFQDRIAAVTVQSAQKQVRMVKYVGEQQPAQGPIEVFKIRHTTKQVGPNTNTSSLPNTMDWNLDDVRRNGPFWNMANEMLKLDQHCPVSQESRFPFHHVSHPNVLLMLNTHQGWDQVF